MSFATLPDVANAPDGRFGPSMLALPNDKMRLFVLKFLELGGGYGSAKKAALEAGYSNGSQNYLVSDDRIQAAIREEATKRLDGGVATAISTLIELCDDTDKRIRLKAATAILNRTGFHETTEQKVTVKNEDISDEELLKRTAELAKKHGIDPKQLLGEAMVEAAALAARPTTAAVEKLPVVDAEFTVTEEDTT
jgi:phage terminase small subunit